MAKTTMKKSKDGYSYGINLNGLTEGELMSLIRALRFYDSPVSNDVLMSILNAAYEHDQTTYSKVMEFIKDVDEAKELEEAKQKALNNAQEVLNQM